MTLQVTKHIVGQSLFQLGVMYGLVVYGDQLFGIANGHTVQGPSQHYTIVFNTFVLMQLFNQVSAELLPLYLIFGAIRTLCCVSDPITTLLSVTTSISCSCFSSFVLTCSHCALVVTWSPVFHLPSR